VAAFGDGRLPVDVELRRRAGAVGEIGIRRRLPSTVVRDVRGRLTVYDKTQGVQNVQNYPCNVFGYARDDIRMVAPFVGGAFGAGLRPQYQVLLAVLAAHVLQRSVRVSLTR
jgi:xanthine dehydrogenase YagR molybdenum-binding subunit